MQLGRIRPIKSLIQSSGYVCPVISEGWMILAVVHQSCCQIFWRDDEVLQIGWDPPVFYCCQMTYCSFSGGADENAKVGY